MVENLENRTTINEQRYPQGTMSTILITGGHATPAFAVLDEILNGQPTTINHQPIWVGEKYNQSGNSKPSPEYITVTEKYKLKFYNIRAGKLVRKWTLQTFVGGLKEFFDLIIGFIQGFYIIAKTRPYIILSFGGFLAVPVVFWGKIFGAKVITHEQTIVTGLANKIIAKFADKILISFKDSEKFYPSNKVVFTGNPIRKDVFEVKSNITKDFNPELPILYITGGNQGAHEINKRVFEVLDDILKEFNVIHQTGNSSVTGDYEKAMLLGRRNVDVSPSQGQYLVRDYVMPDEIGEVMNKADVIISRSGANTVQEILALGKLCILIPIPWTSHDEQTKNAKLVESFGLAKVLKQSDDLTSQDLLSAITEAKNVLVAKTGFDKNNIDFCRKAAKDSIDLHAAENVAEIVRQYLS